MILMAIPSTSFFDNSSKFSGKNDSNCCFFFPLLVDLSIVLVAINPLPKHFSQLLFKPWQVQISDLIYFLLIFLNLYISFAKLLKFYFKIVQNSFIIILCGKTSV